MTSRDSELCWLGVFVKKKFAREGKVRIRVEADRVWFVLFIREDGTQAKPARFVTLLSPNCAQPDSESRDQPALSNPYAQNALQRRWSGHDQDPLSCQT